MQKAMKVLAAFVVMAGLSACQSTDMASRGAASAPMVTLATQGRVVAVDPATQVRAAQYHVVDLQISVPRALKVSEANMFYPVADIVWRGEPRGDRHAQVAAIFQEAMGQGTASMTRGREVRVLVEVTRFHSVTEKTRYTVGGTHSLHFDLTVADALTGEVIDGPRQVVADTRASGGAQAIAEEQMGRTQRVVIVERLAQVIRRELSAAVALTPELVSRLQQDAVVTVSAKNR